MQSYTNCIMILDNHLQKNNIRYWSVLDMRLTKRLLAILQNITYIVKNIKSFLAVSNLV